MMPNDNNQKSDGILRLLFKFRLNSEYIGNSKYLTGNALRHALSMQLDTSIGIFTKYNSVWYPDSYEDFFKIRLKREFLKPHFYFIWDKYKQKRARKYFFKPSHVTFDILNPPSDIIDSIKNNPLIQFGGGRNRGYGKADLADWVWIDPYDLNYSEDATHITLISPLLYIPRFVHKYNCRWDREIFWNNGEKNVLKIVSPGQFFRLKNGKDVVRIAQKGILRKSLFGKFGYGEFFLTNWPNGGIQN